VPTNKPKDVNTFLECMKALKDEVKTADSVLFEEVEKKVSEREKFVTEQTERLKEMEESYSTLRDYQEVLMRAQKLHITGQAKAMVSALSD
jgi:C4-dicarboxylate-specific signal transduction histidine kinase